MIESNHGVTINTCADVTKITQNIIKLDSLIDRDYSIEVTSPGINRPLFIEDDYRDNIGSKVKISLKKMQDNTKNISGTIIEVIDKYVFIKSRNKSYKIGFDNIKKANLRRVM